MPNDEGFLHRYFLTNGHLRLHKWVHYFDIYERHFHRFRGLSPTVCEIGVEGGGSLAMWKAYFGPGAKIIGVDINPRCKMFESDSIDIFIGSQDEEALLGEIVNKYGELDIVIDDGSHLSRHLIKTFAYLYPHVASNGVYLLEDLHACYQKDYEGGYLKPDSFIEYCKHKIDSINANYTAGEVAVDDFTRTTDSMSIYDSVIVFEKRRQGFRAATITGPM